MAGDRQAGYALVAAVAAVAAFAYIAFQVLASGQGDIAGLAARVRRASLAADADAGIMVAIHGLAAEDRSVRWSIDGRSRRLDFNGAQLTVTVEDERGKAPLAGLNDAQARALFAGAGASGDRLDALVDEFHAWRARGSAIDAGRQPFRTVDELAALPDMDPALLARIAPAVTAFFEQSGPFEPRDAGPLALATMSALGGQPGSEFAGPSEISQQRPDEQIAADDHLVGRTLTVRVVARAADGARTHRMAIVELTGARQHPWWIRYVE